MKICKILAICLSTFLFIATGCGTAGGEEAPSAITSSAFSISNPTLSVSSVASSIGSSEPASSMKDANSESSSASSATQTGSEVWNPGTVYSNYDQIDNSHIENYDSGNNYSRAEDGTVTFSYVGKKTAVLPVKISRQGGFYSGFGVFVSEGKTAVVFNNPTAVVYYSSDFGVTWKQSSGIKNDAENDPISNAFIGFTSEKDGWLVLCYDHGVSSEEHELYMTSNGGTTWQKINTDIDTVHGAVLKGANFSNKKIGFLCFRFDSADKNPAFFMTADGGETWKFVSLELPDQYKSYGCDVFSPVFLKSYGYVQVSVYQTGNNPLNAPVLYYLTNNEGASWQYDNTKNTTVAHLTVIS